MEEDAGIGNPWRDNNPWTDLAMWDNVSYHFRPVTYGPVTPEERKEMKKILNKYLNYTLYGGYIHRRQINMHPEIVSESDDEIEYNIYTYPFPMSKTLPEDFYAVIPDMFHVAGRVFQKKGMCKV